MEDRTGDFPSTRAELKPQVRIGIPPAATHLRIADSEHTATEGDGMASNAEADAGESSRYTSVGPFTHDEMNPTHKSWARYAEWRRSKCKPKWMRSEMDELNQATLEFIGEVGELADLVCESGGSALMDEHVRSSVLDEAGDCFFTGIWCVEQWVGESELPRFLPADGNGIGDPSTHGMENEIRSMFVEAAGRRESDNGNAQEGLHNALYLYEQVAAVCCLIAMTRASLTANALKKQMYQHRAQNCGEQALRVLLALGAVQRLLVMLGYTVFDALEANIQKLDARYPNGYVPGVGGGIRR
jgi:hypothetical protein